MRKKRYLLIILLLLFFLIHAIASQEEASVSLKKYIKILMSALDDKGYHAIDTNKYEGIHYLNQGHYIMLDGVFYNDTKYIIVASGDSCVVEIDIEVYDADWNIVFSGNTNGPNEDVVLQLNITTYLHILIRLSNTKKSIGGGYIGHAMFYMQEEE